MSDNEEIINVIKAEYKLKNIPMWTVQYECKNCGYEYKIKEDGHNTVNDYYDDDLVLTCPKCGCHERDGYQTINPKYSKAESNLRKLVEDL